MVLAGRLVDVSDFFLAHATMRWSASGSTRRRNEAKVQYSYYTAFAESMSFGLRLRERAIHANDSRKSKTLRGPLQVYYGTSGVPGWQSMEAMSSQASTARELMYLSDQPLPLCATPL